jgi:general secretion pathway protein N
MVRWFKILGLALLSGGTLSAVPVPVAAAASSATLDILPDEEVGEAATDRGSPKAIPRQDREGGKPIQSGNPLWAVPLQILTTTRERPIFSASRRPPQPAVVAAPVVSAPPPQKPTEPEHPPFVLIGAVVGVGGSDAVAVFLDRPDEKIVRLRRGEAHAGWMLTSVQPREVTFKKAGQIEVLALKRQDGFEAIPDAPALPAPALPVVVPAAGGAKTSYAPFVPRSTPKNGEPDGL